MTNPVEPFQTYRPLLFSIAYRMLGSVMEAEDIVQEAFLRFQNVPLEKIESPRAFLATIVTRLCLNQLESARARREAYIGPWLPEPLMTADDVSADSPGHAILHESLSMAFMMLLEQLTPIERAVFLLREVFEYEYREIADIVGKNEVSCRQLYSRAKRHIAEHRPRFKAKPEEHRALLERFIQAADAGNLEGLVELLAEDVTMVADGGGKARGAATRPLHGQESVARFLLASTRLPGESYYREIAQVNGELAVILRTARRIIVTLFADVEGGRIKTIWAIGNPDKLTRLQSGE